MAAISQKIVYMDLFRNPKFTREKKGGLLQKKSYKASEELAKKFGEPSLLEGYGRRNATLNAIAPTTSSAFILGQVSQGIEPIWSNIYVKDIAKTKTTIKNKFLEKLLESKNKNTNEVWKRIPK